jgi:hypothetical protein
MDMRAVSASSVLGANFPERPLDITNERAAVIASIMNRLFYI